MKFITKPTFRSEWFSLFLIIASIALSLITYKFLPAQIASHWNFAGQVDSYSSKNFQVIFFPVLMLALYLLFLIVPSIDPKKNNYPGFTKTYNIFRDLLLLCFFIIFAATTLFNLGYSINIGVIVAGTVGLLLIIIGLLMRNIKTNYFFGIRTPWTLSSEVVWDKTHKNGSWFFSLFGLIIMIAPWLNPGWALSLFIFGLLTMIFGTFILSYIYYLQEKKKLQKK